MKTKLKNLSVTSVDLVDRGANPDAHVRLFKRREAEPEQDPDTGLFQKFTDLGFKQINIPPRRHSGYLQVLLRPHDIQRLRANGAGCTEYCYFFHGFILFHLIQTK